MPRDFSLGGFCLFLINQIVVRFRCETPDCFTHEMVFRRHWEISAQCGSRSAAGATYQCAIRGRGGKARDLRGRRGGLCRSELAREQDQPADCVALRSAQGPPLSEGRGPSVHGGRIEYAGQPGRRLAGSRFTNAPRRTPPAPSTASLAGSYARGGGSPRSARSGRPGRSWWFFPELPRM